MNSKYINCTHASRVEIVRLDKIVDYGVCGIVLNIFEEF